MINLRNKDTIKDVINALILIILKPPALTSLQYCAYLFCLDHCSTEICKRFCLVFLSVLLANLEVQEFDV